MSKGRQLNKLSLVRQHRENQYEYTLDKLIAGKTTPDEVSRRFKKLKAVRKNG